MSITYNDLATYKITQHDNETHLVDLSESHAGDASGGSIYMYANNPFYKNFLKENYYYHLLEITYYKVANIMALTDFNFWWYCGLTNFFATLHHGIHTMPSMPAVASWSKTYKFNPPLNFGKFNPSTTIPYGYRCQFNNMDALSTFGYHVVFLATKDGTVKDVQLVK